jgi:hypothetical protein
MNKSLSSLSALLAACALHACNADATDHDDTDGNADVVPNDTDTGGPADGDAQYTNNESGFGSGCDAEETELDPNAATSLGFTAQSVLDLVVGEHTQTLAWLDSNLEYGPESGRSEITLSITAAGAPTLVDREPRAAQSGSGATINLPEIAVYCTDSMRVKVNVAITTPGGALDEVVEGVFEAHAGDFASGHLSFELEGLNGSFEATPFVPPNSRLTGSTLTLELGFTEFGASGAFSVGSTFESNDGQAAGVGSSGELAHFPADNYCGPTGASVTADQSVRGLSMGQALDALNAMSPDQVRYQSGAPSDLTLAFTSAEERVCARFDNSQYGGDSVNDMTLEFPGVVRLISADGKIDGTVPLQLSASRENGLQTTRAEGNANAQSAADAPALLPQLGIRDDVDFSAYDGGYVQFLATVADDSVGGSLRVYGLDVADCVTNPPPPDPGGMSSPGCRGTDRVPLWGAFWGDWDVTTQ